VPTGVCVAADPEPERRYATAHDLSEDLRHHLEGLPVAARADTFRYRAGKFVRRHRAAVTGAFLVAASLVVFAAGAGTMWLLRPAAPPSPLPVHSTLEVLPAETLNAGGSLAPFIPTAGGSRTAFAWTPDGRALVFVGARGQTQQLYVRALDRDEARPLPGTEGAQVLAVSADGRWVAFWAGGTIRKVSLAGGPTVDVAGNILRPICCDRSVFVCQTRKEGNDANCRESGQYWRD
jgi:hypothetical protein